MIKWNIYQTDVDCFGTDSTNQTVIINESMSSDGSVAAQLRQQVAAASVSSQPVIMSTSSAPDVFYREPQPPGIGSYHDDNGIAVEATPSGTESSYVYFEDHRHGLAARQNWAGLSRTQDVVPTPQVPAYRPAPDYDTVMQHRILSQCYPSYVHPYLNQDCTSFSQPDIYQHSAVVSQYPGCARKPAAGALGGHAVDRASSLVIHPESVGVARHASVVSSIEPQAYQYLYYRAPPPYPRQSSSTPDLASPTKLGAVLTHGGFNLQQQHLMHGAAQSQFDESLENLAAEVQQVHVYGSHPIDPGQSLSTTDRSAIQAGLTVHPENIVDVARPSATGHYGHSMSSTGSSRLDQRNGEANRLDFLHFDE